jgi:hypothetical protein
MNDTELADAVRSGLTEVCDSLSTVHLAIQASQIMARADRTRRHRRYGVLAGAGGLAAAALAVSVSMALPASSPVNSGHPQASRPAVSPGVRLASWTVTRQPDGRIRVTFFGQLRDPAGLQSTLRADGVPASVTFIGQQNPACKGIPVAPGSVVEGPGFVRDPQNAYNQPQANAPRQVQASGVPNSENPYDQSQGALVINSSALPSGAGLQIAVMRGIPLGPSGPWTYPKGSGQPVVEVFLVKASPQCTGS